MINRLIHLILWAAIAAIPAVEVAVADTPAYQPVPGMEAYVQAADSAAYAEAKAHDPRFGDRTLWPYTTGKEAYVTQAWPKARLLVWAHPGRSSTTNRKGGVDPTDPANWLEEGKPATRLELGPEVDLLLPASDTEYAVGFRGTAVREIVRHVTVERGANWRGGGDGFGRQIAGNVWVKRGGGIYSQGATSFVGQAHTFWRNDNHAMTVPGRNGRPEIPLVSQYFAFTRAQGGSVELLGQNAVLDEFVVSCLVIIGPCSRALAGRRASPKVTKDGHLAFMDGAVWGKWQSELNGIDLHCSGHISGGLPDRPLMRRAQLFIAFKNHSNALYSGTGAEGGPDKPFRHVPVPSLLLAETARIESYGNGRLRIAAAGEVICQSRPKKGWLQEDPACAGRYAWYDTLPRGIDVWVARGAVVAGVEFDDLRRGGILQQEDGIAAAWTDVTFGPGCAAKGADLLSVVPDLKAYAATGTGR